MDFIVAAYFFFATYCYAMRVLKNASGVLWNSVDTFAGLWVSYLQFLRVNKIQKLKRQQNSTWEEYFSGKFFSALYGIMVFNLIANLGMGIRCVIIVALGRSYGVEDQLWFMLSMIENEMEACLKWLCPRELGRLSLTEAPSRAEEAGAVGGDGDTFVGGIAESNKTSPEQGGGGGTNEEFVLDNSDGATGERAQNTTPPNQQHRRP